MGLHRRDAIHGHTDAAPGNRRVGRRASRVTGKSRQHDRHRPGRVHRQGVPVNGVHDMGGMHGFGPIEAEPGEPTFHHEWEARCLALNRAMGFAGIWNIDEARAAIENLPPHRYLAMSYYERWALRLQNLLTERGLVDDQEITAGHASRPGKPLPRMLDPDDVAAVLSRGSY